MCDRVFIGESAAPTVEPHKVWLFVLANVQVDGQTCKLIQSKRAGGQLDFLEVRGIHKFIAILEHELAHRRHAQAGFLVGRFEPGDSDGDGLLDEWERAHCLDPDDPHTTRVTEEYNDPDGDSDVVAEIEAYARLLQQKEKWKEDWADSGLQKGNPPNPFPWKYLSTGTNQPPAGVALLTAIPECRR